MTTITTPASDAVYRSAWGRQIPDIAARARVAPRTVIYLHPPKTGGTTIVGALESAPGWSLARLPLSSRSNPRCDCGQSPCLHGPGRPVGRPPERLGPVDARSLFVKTSHERFRAIRWLRQELAPSPLPPPEVYMGFRPARQRLGSMFSDYWTQVARAEHCAAVDDWPSGRQGEMLRAYPRDAVHYRAERGGRIDGVAWFRAFAQHGAGIPFHYSEIFEGDVAGFEEELLSGRLRLVPTTGMDRFLTRITGRATHARERVSRADDPAVNAALAEASPLLDEIAERDAAFDAVAIAHLARE